MVFERFVSEARDEPPDIDVDFEHERREEVIQYIYKPLRPRTAPGSAPPSSTTAASGRSARSAPPWGSRRDTVAALSVADLGLGRRRACRPSGCASSASTRPTGGSR